jgi:hypothetical protein
MALGEETMNFLLSPAAYNDGYVAFNYTSSEGTRTLGIYRSDGHLN